MNLYPAIIELKTTIWYIKLLELLLFCILKGNYENTEVGKSAPGVSVISDQVYYNADS